MLNLKSNLRSFEVRGEYINKGFFAEKTLNVLRNYENNEIGKKHLLEVEQYMNDVLAVTRKEKMKNLPALEKFVLTKYSIEFCNHDIKTVDLYSIIHMASNELSAILEGKDIKQKKNLEILFKSVRTYCLNQLSLLRGNPL